MLIQSCRAVGPLRQGALISVGDFVDAAEVGERLDVRDQATAEIVAQPRRLPLIKPNSLRLYQLQHRRKC